MPTFIFRTRIVSHPVYEVVADTLEQAVVRFGQRWHYGESPEEEDVSEDELVGVEVDGQTLEDAEVEKIEAVLSDLLDADYEPRED
jgi:hypothetical protein